MKKILKKMNYLRYSGKVNWHEVIFDIVIVGLVWGAIWLMNSL